MIVTGARARAGPHAGTGERRQDVVALGAGARAALVERDDDQQALRKRPEAGEKAVGEPAARESDPGVMAVVADVGNVQREIGKGARAKIGAQLGRRNEPGAARGPPADAREGDERIVLPDILALVGREAASRIAFQ